jgi:hypothetical protein
MSVIFHSLLFPFTACCWSPIPKPFRILHHPSHNILEPTMGVTFFNSDSKSDPTELFPSIVQVIAG